MNPTNPPSAAPGPPDAAGVRAAAGDAEYQSRAFLDSVFEHLPSGVFVKDARDLRYVRVNRASCDLYDVEPSALLGRTDAEVFPPALAVAYEARDRQVLERRAPVDTPGEVVATRRQGARVVHTRRIPILGANGEAQYILGISEDVTEGRTAHEEVRLTRLEAERASRAKSDFLSRMSHDLRTPLNAVLGYAQVLAMDTLSDEQADSLRQILKGGSHVLELINEVLDIARIEAGHLSLSREPVAVADVVPPVVELARPLGSARGIDVTFDAGPCARLYVSADRQRLRQVLLNLVSNGVKYNRDNGSVHVTCAAASGRVRIQVADTGTGIPEEKQPLLFQPFERLGAEQSAIEGTGLGLAVSKGLTEAMGGRIGLQSRPDGSTFWIELPQSDPPAPQVEAAAGIPARQAPAEAAGTVLYVEDNRANVRLLERLMARRPGVRLVAAPTGEAALALTSRERPDLILLDLHLPDMGGGEVLRRLQAEPDTRGIPVAVLSADATASQRQRLMDAGAVAYLTKPLDLQALLALLDERLSAGRARHHDGT
jgi:PAS domain S-box-containing protein